MKKSSREPVKVSVVKPTVKKGRTSKSLVKRPEELQLAASSLRQAVNAPSSSNEPERTKTMLRQFTAKNPASSVIINEVEGEVKKHFGNAGVAFTVEDDLDDKDNKVLVVKIRTDLPPREAIGSLKKMSHSWYYRKSREARRNVLLDVLSV